MDARLAFRRDGAVTAASWLRARARMDPAPASGLVGAARRLRDLPQLRAALEAGAVTLAHATAVTSAAVPGRAAAIAAVEDTLVSLARAASPRDVRVALRRVADAVDPDGSDPLPPIDVDGRDARRWFSLRPTIDGLWNTEGVLTTLAGEALATVLDALDAPDPDTPPERLPLSRAAARRRVGGVGEARARRR